MRDDFNGYTYKNTNGCYGLAKEDPEGLMPNGETRKDWFERVHGVTFSEFAEIQRQRNSTRLVKKRGDG